MLRNPTYPYRAPSPPPHVYPAFDQPLAYHYQQPHLYYPAEQSNHYNPRTHPAPLPSPPPHTLDQVKLKALPSIHSLNPPPLAPRPRSAHRPDHSRHSSDLGRFAFSHRDIRETSPVRFNPYRSPPPTAQSHRTAVKQEPRELPRLSDHPASHRHSYKGEYTPRTPLSATSRSPIMTTPGYKWPGDDKWLPDEGAAQEAVAQEQPAASEPKSTIAASESSETTAAVAEAVAAATAAANEDVTMASAPEIRLPDTLGSASDTPDSAAPHKDIGIPVNGELAVPDRKDTPFSRSPELRVSHKLAERKRRKEMRELFDELREQLPADRGMKASKWEILSRAVDYIQILKGQASDAQRTIGILHRDLAVARGETPNPQWQPTYHNFNLAYVPHATPAQPQPASQPQTAAPLPPAAQPAQTAQPTAAPAPPAVQAPPAAAPAAAPEASTPPQEIQPDNQPAAEPTTAE